MKFIVALEIEAENLHEADHMAEAIHDTVNYYRNEDEQIAVMFVLDVDTFNRLQVEQDEVHPLS